MKRLLVVYHSLTGGTAQMVAAAEAGMRRAEALELIIRRAEDAGADDLIEADGYLFAAPENLAAVAGRMKDFFDRSYYPALGRIEGRPYACMVCAGSDGSNAVRQIERIATGWRLRRALPSLIVCTHAQTPEAILAPKRLLEEDRCRCEELGETLASGLSMGIW